VYGYVSARAFGGDVNTAEMIIGFGLAAVLCIGTLMGSVTLAVRRLQAVEL
jgi:hypothetical protein